MPLEAVFWEYKELRERNFGVSDPVQLKSEWEDKGGLGTTLFPPLFFFFIDFYYFLLIPNYKKKKKRAKRRRFKHI